MLYSLNCKLDTLKNKKFSDNVKVVLLFRSFDNGCGVKKERDQSMNEKVVRGQFMGEGARGRPMDCDIGGGRFPPVLNILFFLIRFVLYPFGSQLQLDIHTSFSI